MKGFNSSMIVGAAVAGLFAGTAALKAAELQTPTSGRSMTRTTLAPFAGNKAQNLDAAAGKNDCKGQNGCKGQGGCKTGDNGCKGKNSCKGKGGCKTSG